jgi:hypothetical protein
LESSKDTLGPIENGIEIHVNASSNGTFNGATDYVPKVYVSSLINNDVNGVSRTITKGMILTSHSNGTVVYNGTNTTGTPLYKGELLIYRIEELNGQYILFLTGYREPITTQLILLLV